VIPDAYQKRILFQTFQWFDGLTMSGFISQLLRFVQRLAAVQSSRFHQFKETLAVQAVPTVQPLRCVQNV